MADDQRDVIEVLEHDHREVEQMFAKLESLRGASTEEAKSRRKKVATTRPHPHVPNERLPRMAAARRHPSSTMRDALAGRGTDDRDRGYDSVSEGLRSRTVQPAGRSQTR